MSFVWLFFGVFALMEIAVLVADRLEARRVISAEAGWESHAEPNVLAEVAPVEDPDLGEVVR